MVKAALFALVAVVATPAVSYACLNEVQQTLDDMIRLVKRAETQFNRGEFKRADNTLRHLATFDRKLSSRIQDLRAIIAVRTNAKAELDGALAYLEKRDETLGNKSMKHRAWRAEAYLAVGKRDEAKAILDDLHTRDLMPDAYGYLALAKLSSGTTRLEMWKACRTRAKDKAMCELPAETVSKAPTK